MKFSICVQMFVMALIIITNNANSNSYYLRKENKKNQINKINQIKIDKLTNGITDYYNSIINNVRVIPKKNSIKLTNLQSRFSHRIIKPTLVYSVNITDMCPIIFPIQVSTNNNIITNTIQRNLRIQEPFTNKIDSTNNKPTYYLRGSFIN